jgi:hypothetical protein
MLLPALLTALLAAPVCADDGSWAGGSADILAGARSHGSAGPAAAGAAAVGDVASPPKTAAAPAASPAASGPAKWDVDLSAQLPDNGGNQGSIGDCHDFAAVNLLEAALYRRTGQHTSLSPADLFIQHTVLGPQFFEDFDVRTGRPAEGGFENYDAQYGLDQGVATHLDYDKFQKLYNDYLNSTLDPEIQSLHLLSLPSSDDAKNPMIAATTKAAAATDQAALDRASKSFDKKTHAVMDRIYQQIDPRAATERMNLKQAVNGYRAASKTYPSNEVDYQSTWDNKSVNEQYAFHYCAEVGAAQTAVIRAELDAGRPVAVGLDIGGLPADGPTMTETDYGRIPKGIKPANHAVLVVGYVQLWKGYYAYKVRNWWGVQNIGFVRLGGALQRGALWDADACRIHLITTVLTPNETSTLPGLSSKAAH